MSRTSPRITFIVVGCLLALSSPTRSAAAQSRAEADRAAKGPGSSDSVVTVMLDRTDAAAARPDHAVPVERVTADVRGPEPRPAGLQAAKANDRAPVDADRDKDVSVGSNLALMGVGAAAVVVGLLVGGDGGTAIAVGGGVIGLIGLYRYLR